MAKSTATGEKKSTNDFRTKRTSIGRSPYSRPSSKDQKRSWKKYRGQG